MVTFCQGISCMAQLDSEVACNTERHSVITWVVTMNYLNTTFNRLFALLSLSVSQFQVISSNWFANGCLRVLRLVFTSDGVGRIVSGVVRVLMTLWKEKISLKQSHMRVRIRVEGRRTFPFSFDFALRHLQNQIVGVGRMNQSQCTFPCFVTGFVLLLLLATPTA